MSDSAWSNEALFSSKATEWATPWELFNVLDKEFGFCLDAAASPHNAKVVKYFTEEEDGLSQDWEAASKGEAVWVNPPYGRGVGEWVEKAYTTSLNGTTVVMLTFARTDTKWWQTWASRAAEIRFIRGRVHFERGAATGPATAPSAILVFSEERRVPAVSHICLPRGT